jgi:ABC-type xylose transport system permease subunit
VAGVAALAIGRTEAFEGRILMNERLRDVWIPGICFIVTLGSALALVGAVVIIPWIAEALPQHPIFAMYAHDVTVRRTSLAAAGGLAVTAFVFFRPAGWRRKRETKADAPTIAGA